MYSSEQRSVRWENQRPYLHLVLTSILHPSSDLVLINVWHENVTKSELSFPREITNTALPLLITVKIKSSSVCSSCWVSMSQFISTYISHICRLLAEMCYICTLLLLTRSSALSVGGLAGCPRHVHYIKLPVVIGVSICHIIPPKYQWDGFISMRNCRELCRH